MFSGIVETMGRIVSITSTDQGKSKKMTIKSDLDHQKLKIGASISHAGCCLSVIEKPILKNDYTYHTVQIMEETLEKTNLNHYLADQLINLETGLAFGDEVGGHLVTGHIDGIGVLVSRQKRGGSVRLVFSTGSLINMYLAKKGSICIDGVSLTIADSGKKEFSVDLIEHTQSVTTLGTLKPGDRVNLEVDLIARYIARMFDRD